MAYCRHIYDIHGINSQVGQCCGICCVVYSQKVNSTLKNERIISNVVSSGMPVKVFFL